MEARKTRDSSADAKAPPVRIIFDNDPGSDCDDAGALHALADRGGCEILGTMVSTRHPWSAPAVAAIPACYGGLELPLGSVKGSGWNGPSRFAKPLAEEFPQPIKSGDDAPDALPLYRALFEQPHAWKATRPARDCCRRFVKARQ
jgi:hypothetical protein